MVVHLDTGDAAPDFTLPGADGATVTLGSLLGRRSILYFYPAAGTPGCTTEACDFRDNLASLHAAGVTVVGISPDPPHRLAEWARTEQLTYPLLSDVDGSVHRSYGAWGEKTVNGTTGAGPLRSTFVLDATGRIEHARYAVQAQGHVRQLRALLGI
ncbi:peroxiredoxin [Amycolatopsis granulosa]|uniref:peroxiredoxin n=1 Tax=Amycolatopsis granulosa TaxID=185684 RepID=UPI0014221127|nr:peroxiredoxin [Amycolatopsis granulosa]NIH83286.1 peroxiredoxin Q/BCP [Amycolatopsis granulosa]